MNKSKYFAFVGVDPGLTGAVAILDASGKLLSVRDMPTEAQGGFVKRRVDPVALARMMVEGAAEVNACLGLNIEPPRGFCDDITTLVAKKEKTPQNAFKSFLACIEIAGYRQGQGALSGASLASSMAYAEGVMVGLGMEVMRMPPGTWKSALGLTGAGKRGSVDFAKKITGQSLRHDQAEAVLLAYFAFLNGNTWQRPRVVTSNVAAQHNVGESVVKQAKKPPAAKTGEKAGKGPGARRSARDSDDLGAFRIDD